MLRYLKIDNLAVIDRALLEIGDGFVCLTGESGAGKSVLIDALLLLAGERASSDLVRSGCDKAVVEAEFELDEQPPELSLLDGAQLYLRREVSKDGKSRAFVNGVMVPNSQMQHYAELVFEIHGQHGQQRLLKNKHHLELFEEQTGVGDASRAFQPVLTRFRSDWDAYWDAVEGQAARLREMDFLRLQIQEIREVNPCEADRDLDLRLSKIRNLASITGYYQELEDLLGGHLLRDLKRMRGLVEKLSAFETKLVPYLDQVAALGATLEDLHAEIRYAETNEDESSLDALEARESALNRLYMKYGRDLDEVLSELARLEQRLEELECTSDGLEGRHASLERSYAELLKARDRLKHTREDAVGAFVADVSKGLLALSLPHAEFRVKYAEPPWPQCLPDTRELRLPGPDFHFLFSPNPGEEPRPLAKVASGGELSRVLLALISAFKRPSRRLLVFDEIDAGLGGETAHAVGAKLAALGRHHQVLCVTHFAQVARFADQQIKLSKSVEGGRTFTVLMSCDREQRIAELARLMGGDADAGALRDHARKLLRDGAQAQPVAP